MALFSKVSDGISITIGVTAGETLVGRVEESNVLLLLHDLANLAPLGLSGVNSSWVVSTSMEQDNALRRSSLDILEQTLKVQSNGILVVVAVLDDLEARVLED